LDFKLAPVERKAVVEAGDPDDPIRQLLFNSLSQYNRGNYKSAMEQGASALNLIAAEKDINGGGWS